MTSNDTQRVVLSEDFEDDLYYTATVTVERTEVLFNRETVVFVRLSNNPGSVTLSLTADEIATFITAYTAYQREQERARALFEPTAFRIWLEARRTQSVGTTSRGPRSPVAVWLSELHVHPYSIGDDVYGPVSSDEMHSAPAWMQEVVARLATEEHDEFTGERVLETLRACLLDADEDLDAHPF